MRHKRILLAVASVLSLFSLSGCSTIGYYSQAVQGHLALMRAREPIAELLAANDTPRELRDKLQTVSSARRFAIDVLQLPDNDSYSTYAATGRDYVTWNVVAADEFSVRARTWCFPVAGCVSYRGYFDKADAERYAAELAQGPVDVTIGGASAYSTLGWFNDPVLDTMLRGSELRYVGTLFHELAHQVVYIKDESDFNEAFASFVEQEGMRQWLHFQQTPERIAQFEARLQRGSQFVELLRTTRAALQALYQQPLADTDKRERKAALFDNMREQYNALKIEWDGYNGYDGWFSRELNNARLVSVSTYRRLVPAFARLFEASGGDISRFYREVKALAALDKAARADQLQRLLDGSVALLSR